MINEGLFPSPCCNSWSWREGSEDTEKFRELSPCPWLSRSWMNLVGSGWGWLAGLPVWADRSRGHLLGLAKKKVKNVLFWTGSSAYVCVVFWKSHCTAAVPANAPANGVMLSRRAVLVQSVSTWLGHFMVLLEDEHDNLLLVLYKAWARWTRISLKNNLWPEKNKRWDWDINLKAGWLCDLGTLHSRFFFFFKILG